MPKIALEGKNLITTYLPEMDRSFEIRRNADLNAVPPSSHF